MRCLSAPLGLLGIVWLLSMSGAAQSGPPTPVPFVRYFAEGATGPFFDSEFSFFNPWNDRTASVRLDFARSDGGTVAHELTLPPFAHATIDAESIPGLESAEFSTIVTSDFEVVAERSMRWGDPSYGSHTGTSLADASATWHFAEGLACCDFDTFLLLFNPNPGPVDIWITYRDDSQGMFVTSHRLAPARRSTIWVNLDDPRLAARPFGMSVTTRCPPEATCPVPGGGEAIVVERAVYHSTADRVFDAGHVGGGLPAALPAWDLAEGATGYFDAFLLLVNPGLEPIRVRARFNALGARVVEREYHVPARLRRSVWLNLDPDLAAGDFGIGLWTDPPRPFIVERSMWWPSGGFESWRAGHVGRGTPPTGRRWAVTADLRNPRSRHFLLIAEPGAVPVPPSYAAAQGVEVTVTAVVESSSPVSRTFHLAGTTHAAARLTLDVAQFWPEAVGRRVGFVVENATRYSFDPVVLPISVEMASYEGLGTGDAEQGDVRPGTDVTGAWVIYGAGHPFFDATTFVRVGQSVTFENVRAPLPDGRYARPILSPVPGFPPCPELVNLPPLVPFTRVRTAPFHAAGECRYLIDYISLSVPRGRIVVVDGPVARP